MLNNALHIDPTLFLLQYFKFFEFKKNVNVNSKAT